MEPGSQFLHQKDPKLHISPPVEHEKSRLERAGEQTSQRPSDKLNAWLAVLERTHGHSEYPRVLERIKHSYHKHYVIDAEAVPESAFELEARIAREQGHGDVPITEEFKQAKRAEVITNQQASLDKWVDYLTSEDAMYPTWAKYWAFNAITKMGKFEKKLVTQPDGSEHEVARFAKRDATTVAPFAPLNPRALALTIEAMQDRLTSKHLPKNDRHPKNLSTKLDNPEFVHLLSSESFSKLYTQFLIELPEYSAEGLQEIRGEWVVYPQGSDPQLLVDSLDGYPLEWCTANVDTAASQLAGGDFYVYYSLNQNGQATIPRVAIRMQQGSIAEVRGIAPDQNVDPYIAPVVEHKMSEFADGESYKKKAEDMRTLTHIEEYLRANPSSPLTKQQVRFLYELGNPIEGFGYERDPRIDEIKERRGSQDHELLQELVIETLREKFEASYSAYHTIAEQLNAQRPPQEHLATLSPEHVHNLFEAKMVEWQSRGVLDWVREKIITDGCIHTLVITPQTLASPQELIALGEKFGQGQPYPLYKNEDFLNRYSAAELSGQLQGSEPLRFSLIPSKYTSDLGRQPASEQKDILQTMQHQQPDYQLHVPSMLEAINYWQALRAQGNGLDTSGAFERTYIRHIDLREEVLGADLCVPYSCVGDFGRASLYGDYVRYDDNTRVAVG